MFENKWKILSITVEGTILLTLTVIALYITREDYLKFASSDSTFKRVELEIKKVPTITLCFASPHQNFTYDKDFHIKKYTNYSSFQDNDGVELSLDHDNVKQVQMSLTKVFTVYKGTCYIMYSNGSIEDVLGPMGYGGISINFNPSIPSLKLPTLEMYLTSENNAYGIVRSAWVDGDAKFIKVSPKEKLLDIGIREKVYKFLSDGTNDMKKCRKEPFYDCYGKALLKANFSKCSKTCLPHSMPIDWMEKNNFTLCQKNTEEMNCSRNVTYDLKTDIMSKNICRPRPCSTIEYSGKIISAEGSTENQYSRKISYFFLPPRSVIVNEEYVIYDFIGMLGYIGGTLGMFIGFSFVGLASSLLQHLKSLIKYVKYKNNLPTRPLANVYVVNTPKQSYSNNYNITMQLQALEERVKVLEYQSSYCHVQCHD